MDQGYHQYKDYCHPQPGNIYQPNQSRSTHLTLHHHLHHPQQLHQQSHHAAIKQAQAREDFTGLDNDGIDFSQLEDFIANEADPNGSYFADTLANSEASKHASQNGQSIRDRIIVVTNLPSADGSIEFSSGPKVCPSSANQRLTTGYGNGVVPHNLPDSPPDSGSEPPYSPTDPGSRSPNHKGSTINGRRNLHELLLNPIYPQNGSGASGPMLPILHHDISSLESPLPHITPSIHVPSLIPISTSTTDSGGNPTNVSISLSVIDARQGNSSQLSVEHPDTPLVSQTISTPSHQDVIVPFYTPLQPVQVVHPPQPESSRGRKRKSSGSGTGNKGKMSIVNVKQEPEMSPVDSNSSNNNSGSTSSNESAGNVDDEFFDLSNDPSMFMDPNYQCIKFQPFQDNTWNSLTDDSFKELSPTFFKVDADKGFNFSNADDAFVCQKKNHFQITCHVRHQGIVKYAKTPEGYKVVDNFQVHFYGVKAESPNQSIKIEQSQSDRSKKPFHPVPIEVDSDNVAKLTVGRLHFNETTSNNMRKKGKPNPDQRYFYLVVALHAHCRDGGSYLIAAQSSQRIIVRASNPGQFESDMELSWQKGHTSDSIYHAGRVGINMDRPEEALVVYGNCKITGQIIHPSDMRAKKDITEVDSKQQLRNVQQLRVVRYKYNPEFARLIGLPDEDAIDTGVIAQEVQKILPDAVKETGAIELPNGDKIDNFLVVNKERIFMENIGAVKELCKVTGKLETRIDHLEKITSANREIRNSTLRSNNSDYSKKRSSKDSTRSVTEYFCSNKCVQLLIVILVIIMAFCLVAMAALYMLEYHKRSSYDYHHHGSHIIYNVSHEFRNIPSSEFRGGYPNFPNPSTYYPGSIPPHNFNPPTKHPKVFGKVNTGSSTKTLEDSNSHPVYPKPKVLGRPQYCFSSLPYLDTHCGTFCCGGSSIPGTALDYLDIERKNQVASNAVSSTRLFPSPPTLPPQNNNSEDVISSFSNNPVHRNGLDSKRRKRRQIDENPKLITVPSIRILSHNINQSLDASYCMINSNGYHDCVSTENRYFSSANLTYHVPLSKYWDEVYVSLIFRFSPRVNISQPQICHKYFEQPYCRLDDNSPSVEEKSYPDFKAASEGKNTFSVHLKVGGSPYSRFNIRFSSYPEDHEKLCLLRKNVFEFNFHFYRVCHE